MFARIVQVQIHPEKIDSFKNQFSSEVLSILKKSTGFVDIVSLVSESTPTTVMSLTLWKTKSDLEKYERENFPLIMQKLRPLLTTDPKVEVFNVHTSTFHRITSGMAA